MKDDKLKMFFLRRTQLFIKVFFLVLLFNGFSLRAAVNIDDITNEKCSATQQLQTVKGKVVDDKGNPLLGVTIFSAIKEWDYSATQGSIDVEAETTLNSKLLLFVRSSNSKNSLENEDWLQVNSKSFIVDKVDYLAMPGSLFRTITAGAGAIWNH